MDDEELYDEFGNYIGPEVRDDDEDDDEEDSDDELEHAYASRWGLF
jgi:U5 small nuclear ribonucleoprotein component